MNNPQPRPAGRPRSTTVDERILHSALELLRDQGYRAVSIEGIAAHSGVAKQTIYRRWKSRGEIILDAFATLATQVLTLPDTGSFQTDLSDLLRQTFKEQRDRSGPINRALVAEALASPEFAEQLRQRLISVRRAAARELLHRARARGEIRDGDDEVLLDLTFGPMWYRLLIGHAPLDDNFADALAQRVTAAAQA